MSRAGVGIFICRRGNAQRPLCRWPGCKRYATQAWWGCRPHWFKLLPDLRARLWRTTLAEISANGGLGRAWQAVADEADRFAAEKAAAPAPTPDRRQPELPL